MANGRENLGLDQKNRELVAQLMGPGYNWKGSETTKAEAAPKRRGIDESFATTLVGMALLKEIERGHNDGIWNVVTCEEDVQQAINANDFVQQGAYIEMNNPQSQNWMKAIEFYSQQNGVFETEGSRKRKRGAEEQDESCHLAKKRIKRPGSPEGLFRRWVPEHVLEHTST